METGHVPYSNRTPGDNLPPTPPALAPGGPLASQPLGHDIDTVHFRLDGSWSADSPNLRGLHDIQVVHGDASWLKTQGRFNNFRVAVTPSAIRGRGSLAVLASDTNAAPYDRSRALSALGALADAIGLPLSTLLTAVVTRLDVGANVPVDRPVREYADSILPPPRWMKRVFGPASAAVTTTRGGLYLYDKRAERGKKYVSPTYGPGPLARVERRWTRQVTRQLGRLVTLEDLVDPSFFASLGRRLVSDIEPVPFRPSIRPRGRTSVPERRDGYALLGIEAGGGLEAALAAIGSDREAGVLNSDQARAHRRWLRDLVDRERAASSHDLGREFAAAVRATVG